MQAIKGAFVTVKYTGSPNTFMVFNDTKRFKGFSKLVEENGLSVRVSSCRLIYMCGYETQMISL